jgi:hypothetical protein
MHPAGPDYVDAPALPLPVSSVPLPPLGVEDDDAQTTVSTTPYRPEDALDAELHQVFQQFVETKHRCGEPVEGLTYDKFVGKLKANREQLLQRYGCREIRFSVYVKDGKAALKATPVTG